MQHAELHIAPQDAGRIYHHDAAVASTMTHGHRHPEWEINLVTRGHAAYLIDGRRVPLAVDSLLWLLPTQGHLLLDRSDDFQMWILVVRPAIVRRLSRDEAFAPWRPWLRGKRPPLQHRTISEDAARWIAEQSARFFPQNPEEETPPDQPPAPLGPRHLEAALTLLVAEAWHAMQNAPDCPAGSHLHPAVQQAALWLADHAHEPAADDLNALARHCHVSRPHLSRIFRQQTGQTLTDFRNRRRAQRFFNLYGRGGRLTLTQAAYAAGFGSYAQAYRVIKAVTGHNPRAAAHI